MLFKAVLSDREEADELGAYQKLTYLIRDFIQTLGLIDAALEQLDSDQELSQADVAYLLNSFCGGCD